MAGIGKSLAFYAKYVHEMDAFFDGDDDNLPLESLPNASEVVAMATTVIDQASTEVGELLIAAGENLTRHFGAFCDFELSKKKISSIATSWEIEYRLWIGIKPTKPRVTVGISIITHRDKLCAISWIWRNGGMAGEEAISRALGDSVIQHSADFQWNRGTVAVGVKPFLTELIEPECDFSLATTRICSALISLPESKIRKIYTETT